MSASRLLIAAAVLLFVVAALGDRTQAQPGAQPGQMRGVPAPGSGPAGPAPINPAGPPPFGAAGPQSGVGTGNPAGPVNPALPINPAGPPPIGAGALPGNPAGPPADIPAVPNQPLPRAPQPQVLPGGGPVNGMSNPAGAVLPGGGPGTGTRNRAGSVLPGGTPD
jgi:hypothetical protein